MVISEDIRKNNKKITMEVIFIVAYCVQLISRVYVISGVYESWLNPTLIQIGYIIALLIAEILNNRKCVYVIRKDSSFVILLMLGIYAIVFGYIFVNPVMKIYTSEFALRQLLFLGVVITTVMFVRKYHLFKTLIKTNYFALTTVLIVQFCLNIKDISQIHIFNIFNIDTRTRVNFGLGHWNNLGAVCAASIIMCIFMFNICTVKKIEKKIIYIIMIPIVVMLLGSASRGSIIGIAIFIVTERFIKLNKKIQGKKYKLLLKTTVLLLAIMVIFLSIYGGTYKSALMYSNRFTIFYNAMPIFFKSKRTLIGLGLASPEIYGQNLTPYRTYWLDNGYIYTLITTGYIGCIIYGSVVVLLWKKLKKQSKKNALGRMIWGVLMLYLFGALFEATLFCGGTLQNYIYVPMLILCCNEKICEDND